MSSSTTSNYRGGGGDDNNQQSLQQPLNNNLPHSPTTSGITPSNSVGSERLRFHERTGSLVKLSCNGRAAERMRPLDEFNNAVVMTHRPLVSDTMFEIRIDRLVKKWSGSIEVGVTTHDPSQLEFPATMTNMRSGTVMMSGCGILTNGKGTKREYGEYNLDELRVGDRIGMMRKSNGDLHYFINGLDQGVAASRVPESIWGVVDLYGMTVKVTIVDRDEREEQNLITRRNTVLRENVMQSLTDVSDDDSEDRLLFHPNCGSHAAVINNGRTAHRPNSLDDFNNAVVLTNRPLKLNEVFEVRIDKMVTKWAGSIEVGVTTHAPNELEYPSTMTNVRSGTWIMTGNSVMHNGTSVIDDYGQNLDRLQMGSRVGVVIREGGCLHFLVNGEDQGEAGVGLPPRLYAVIDLYGQATQASIVSHCPSCSPTAPLPPASEIHFHSVHGRNARVTNGGKTASRPRSTVEFNDAIVITNRPLRPGEMFSVVVERIVDRWSGSIEAGVTAIRPDELELPGTMTDLDHDTWMLSGFAVMKDGVTLRHGYPLDLDNVGVGSVVGMKLLEGGSLHYYLDGVDQGEACSGLPEAVYPVVDLYGQCAQVSIVSSLEPVMEIDESTCHQLPSHSPSDTTVLPNHQHLLHKLHSVVGTAVTLDERLISAWRSCQVPCGGLVYGSAPLATGELFEVVLESHAGQWAGALAVGLASGPQPLDKSRVPLQITAVKEYVCYVAGSDVFQNGELIRRNYCPSLEWPRPPARIGIKRATDATLHLYLDGVDQGVAAHNIPKKVYPVIDMYGSTCGLRVVSKEGVPNIADAPTQPAHAELESLCDKNYVEGASSEGKKNNEDMEKSVEDGDLVSEIHDVDGDLHVFHELHGRNVQVSENRLAAKRVASYNQGLVLVNNHSSRRGHLFQICVESLNTRWVSSLSIGIASPSTLSSTLPVTALGLKKDAWIISGDCVYHNGYKVKSKYGPNLDTLGVGSLVGILVDEENNLKLFVNGVDHGVAATNVPKLWIPVLDLYGMCDQRRVIRRGRRNSESPPGLQGHLGSVARTQPEEEVVVGWTQQEPNQTR
ncbi:hypothetical protein AAG570_005130 [Ranatra chinensis]|uniref:NHR domain-containing protein n=1 Tax=Ranatra chinensis TaxID=642074 RepID=A0ABD0YCA4_9HEMI